jgi:hypothetical protein
VPCLSGTERESLYGRWHEAVERSLHWEKPK